MSVGLLLYLLSVYVTRQGLNVQRVHENFNFSGFVENSSDVFGIHFNQKKKWLNQERKGHKNNCRVCLAAKMSPKQINEDLVTSQLKELDRKNAVSNNNKKKKKMKLG